MCVSKFMKQPLSNAQSIKHYARFKIDKLFCDAFRPSIEHYQAVVRYYANYKQATKNIV